MNDPVRAGLIAAAEIAKLWHRLHPPKEDPMITTAVTHTVCAHHFDRAGTWPMPDGTWRCDSCHDEPRVIDWITADQDQTCGGCEAQVQAGAALAVLDTSPRTVVCENCIDY